MRNRRLMIGYIINVEEERSGDVLLMEQSQRITIFMREVKRRIEDDQARICEMSRKSIGGNQSVHPRGLARAAMFVSPRAAHK